MNRRNLVLGIGAVSVAGFGLAGFAYNRTNTKPQAAALSAESTTLVRPIEKKIMAEYPNDVRLVFRYAAFHKGSDEVVRILEMAPKQNKFRIITEAILAAQPEWADHHQPNVAKAWQAAAAAGLDEAAARKGMMAPEIMAVLTQDAADIRAVGVRQTPTFFVNGKPLPSFGVRQLQELVKNEVELVRKN